MTALLDHIWRLMTFRHDLRGLDARHITTVAAVIALSCAASWWRWSGQTYLGHGLLLLLIWRYSSVRMAVAYALISLGIDVLATITGSVIHDRYFLFGWWELSALIVAFVRIATKETAN